MHNSTAQQQQQMNLSNLDLVQLEKIPQVSTFLNQKNGAQNAGQGGANNDQMVVVLVPTNRFGGN